MFAHRIKMEALERGTNFLVGDTEVTLQICTTSGRLITVVNDPTPAIHRNSPESLIEGTTFRVGEAEVTLETYKTRPHAKKLRLLVLIDAPRECRIDMNPDEQGTTTSPGIG